MAWPSITTISRSSEISPAAPIRCSSSERVMHAPTLGVGEQRGERRRLAETRPVLAELGGARQHFLPRPVEERALLGRQRTSPRKPWRYACSLVGSASQLWLAPSAPRLRSRSSRLGLSVRLIVDVAPGCAAEVDSAVWRRGAGERCARSDEVRHRSLLPPEHRTRPTRPRRARCFPGDRYAAAGVAVTSGACSSGVLLFVMARMTGGKSVG